MPLASREREAIAVEEVLKPEGLRDVREALAYPLGRNAEILGGEGEFPCGVQAEELRLWVLEDRRDLGRELPELTRRGTSPQTSTSPDSSPS